jgi:hypothetical protein
LTHPTIKTSLGLWVKSDPLSQQAPVFEDDEPEEFIAYAENSAENLIAKASALLYLSCAGRKGELRAGHYLGGHFTRTSGWSHGMDDFLHT